MAANTIPIFTKTPHIGIGVISTANSNRDGTGTIETIFTAGADGSRIHRIIVKATVTTTAGTVRLFLYNGTNYFLMRELAIPAVTVSATQGAYDLVLEFLGERAIILPASYSIRASTEKAENFNIIIEGADF